jgi:hypothetical protein
MKAFPKVGLLTVVALLVTAAMATSAPAVTINPDDTAVSGLSTDSSLSYGVATIRCDTATMDGTTGLDSDRISDLALQFFGNCAVVGVSPVEIGCEGDISLIAQADTPTGGSGTVDLNDTFRCVMQSPQCTLTVAGPQTTQDGNVVLNESTDVLSVNLNWQVTRTGSALCGPASGTGNLTANYMMAPSTLTIDP